MVGSIQDFVFNIFLLAIRSLFFETSHYPSEHARPIGLGEIHSTVLKFSCFSEHGFIIHGLLQMV